MYECTCVGHGYGILGVSVITLASFMGQETTRFLILLAKGPRYQYVVFCGS